MADGYEQLQRFFENISGTVAIDSTTTTVTPLTGRTLDTICLQRLIVGIVSAGSPNTKWTVTDTNGSVITANFSADTEGSVSRDLSAQGRALKEGEGLQIVCDPGASGLVTWEGYRKRTGVGAA